jgi:hypothetical protein
MGETPHSYHCADRHILRPAMPAMRAVALDKANSFLHEWTRRARLDYAICKPDRRIISEDDVIATIAEAGRVKPVGSMSQLTSGAKIIWQTGGGHIPPRRSRVHSKSLAVVLACNC